MVLYRFFRWWHPLRLLLGALNGISCCADRFDGHYALDHPMMVINLPSAAASQPK